MHLTCSICFGSLLKDTQVVATRCGHVFHHTCLDTWLVRNDSCPKCRAFNTFDTVLKVFLSDALTECPCNALELEIQTTIELLKDSIAIGKKLKQELQGAKAERDKLANKLQSSEFQMETFKVSCESSWDREQTLLMQMKRLKKMCDELTSDNKRLTETVEYLNKLEIRNQGLENVDNILEEYGQSTSNELASIKRLTEAVEYLNELEISEQSLENEGKALEEYGAKGCPKSLFKVAASHLGFTRMFRFTRDRRAVRKQLFNNRKTTLSSKMN